MSATVTSAAMDPRYIHLISTHCVISCFFDTLAPTIHVSPNVFPQISQFFLEHQIDQLYRDVRQRQRQGVQHHKGG